jgi:hypothetical protein
MSQDIAKAIRKEFTSSNPLPVSGGSGGGDASAANQAIEIARLEDIRDRLPIAQLTPSFTSATSSGTVSAGKLSVAITNFGDASGTLLGNSFPAGASISFTAPRGQTLGAIAYNATGTTFLITGLE